MPEDNIAKIKDRIDVVDLVSSYIKLQKAGMNFKARCPFHNEKSGSFFVSPERQIWHCFGCGLGGDIFGFVKQIEGVEFPEALRILATRAGIELTYVKPEDRSKKTSLYEINELAMRFFQKQLQSSAGKEATQYLKKRGIDDGSISNFKLGYSPDNWDALANFLSRKYDYKDIVDAGLIIKKDRDQGYFDRFRSRIMFPIADVHGQIVGFTGRVFGRLAKKEDVGKYVNTPQTVVYDKSRVLYGLDKARLDVRRAGRCIVVEGNTDVIMSHQVGVNNVIASSGTALTDPHLKILKRYTDTLDLCFDTDEAGDTAALRGVGLALAQGFNVNMLSVPSGKDPADYIAEHGDDWKDYVTKPQPFMEYYFDKMRKQFDMSSAQGKKQFSQSLLPLVASLQNKVEQSHWIGEIATALKVKEDILFAELETTKPLAQTYETQNKTTRTEKVQQDSDEPERQFNMYEESMLGMLMREPKLKEEIGSEQQTYLSQPLQIVIEKIETTDKEGNPHDVLVRLTDKATGEDMSMEFAYLKAQELWQGFSVHELEEELKKLLKYIKKRSIGTKLEQLEFDIKAAEKAGDSARLKELLTEFTHLSHTIGDSE